MICLRLVALAALSLLLPDAASAALTELRAGEVQVGAHHSATVASRGRFDLVGLHWRGPGRVDLRTRSLDGTWSPWRPAAPEGEDAPDAASPEDRTEGWRQGNPWWAGPSDRLQVRTHGRVTRIRAWTVRSPASLLPLRTVAAASPPAIVPRAAWGADESIRRGETAYAPELRFAVIHHTAGANDYTKAEAPAIVRAIQRYHVQANGWNDIGYNFLVDRFGTVYEGRYGGVEANVVGAHAVGFNTGSVGVALLGTYGSGVTPAPAEKAIARLLAWRLDLAHVDPLSSPLVVSGGSPKVPVGMPVLLRAVSGHRDVGLTECPGSALYARLSAISAESARIGLPKLYEPEATVEGTLVRFGARLSQALPWSVTVSGEQGAAIATGNGSGERVEWDWDTTGAPGSEYRWLIEAGSGSAVATPAAGIVAVGGSPPPLALTGLVADPATVSPNGDGAGDTSEIRYTLTAPAIVTLTVTDATGVEVAHVEAARWRRAGTHAATLDAASLSDGAYEVVVLARSADGTEATASVAVTVTRTLGHAWLAPPLVSPNGDGRADTLRLAFTLTRPASVTVRAWRDGAAVARVLAERLAAGRHAVRWDGTKPTGAIRDGSFTLVVEARDGTSTARAELPFSSDTSPPRLRLVSRRPPRLAVNEAAALRLSANGAVLRLKTGQAATVVIPRIRELRTLEADAWDLAGNTATLRVRRAPRRGQ
jgi:hypothetical protein